MKVGLKGYRFAIVAAIGLLVVLLAIMGNDLLSKLRDLSTAKDDNTQWGISQLDAEFANLHVTLLNEGNVGDSIDDEIRLRLDIAISRLGILNSGRAATFFDGHSNAQSLIASVSKFADQASALSDQPGPMTKGMILQLRNLTESIRPDVRKISLLGIEIGAERLGAQRAELASQLTMTGGTTIVLLVLMTALMLLLDLLLKRAVRRDAQLLTASKLLESTVAASLDAIVTSNDKGEIIEFNAAAEDIFGWSREEIIGCTMESTFIPHRMRDAHRTGMKRFLKTGTPHMVDGGRDELAALRKSGEEFPIDLSIASITGNEGTQFIAYIQDISDRKNNEQKLIDARDIAKKADAAKSQFLTVMSHEMRTPLNGIMGVLELLKTTDLTEKQTHYVQIATASGEILLEHTNEALDITRIETGVLHLTPHDFDLPELLTSMVGILEPLAKEKNLQLSLNIEEAVRAGFYGDGNRVRQILFNLVGNAIKFTREGGISIHVSGRHGADETAVTFAVSDTGSGINIAQQEHIFEDSIALRHNCEGRQSRGDGLGLSISRRIARRLGGDITVFSENGAGSTFALIVPLKPQKTGQLEATKRQTMEPASHGRARRVLVVEDNEINLKVLRDMLQSLGHHVTQALNGADCLEQANRERFDLIFMDISMPIMDGIEATKRLRQSDGPNVATYIVGLTAHGREEYRERGERAGMNSFYTKPIRFSVLNEIISGVERAPKDTEHNLQNLPEKLNELCAVLGRDKVQLTMKVFFAELTKFAEAIGSGATSIAGSRLTEEAHKLKGAAALLGQHDLEKRLAVIEEITQKNSTVDLSQWANDLAKTAATAQMEFAAALPK